MPVSNIVDHRTNKYDVNVDVVFEPSAHDNHIYGATKHAVVMVDGRPEFTVDDLYNTTVGAAIKYADSWSSPVTMYLYNVGSKPIG